MVENPANLTVVCSIIYGILECTVSMHWCLCTLKKLEVCKNESYLGLFRICLKHAIFCRHSGRPYTSESHSSSFCLDVSPCSPSPHFVLLMERVSESLRYKQFGSLNCVSWYFGMSLTWGH